MYGHVRVTPRLLVYGSFSRPIENGQDKNASEYVVNKSKTMAAELRRILESHLLQVTYIYTYVAYNKLPFVRAHLVQVALRVACGFSAVRLCDMLDFLYIRRLHKKGECIGNSPNPCRVTKAHEENDGLTRRKYTASVCSFCLPLLSKTKARSAGSFPGFLFCAYEASLMISRCYAFSHFLLSSQGGLPHLTDEEQRAQHSKTALPAGYIVGASETWPT